MNRMLTTLLIWLLMAALPLHAVAASINMSCAPVPSQPDIALAAGHASHETSGDAHAHHGAHAAGASDAASGATSNDDGHHAKTGKLGHSSCSACSAFCAGAVAPPSFSLPLPAFDGSDALLVAGADLLAGFIPDGPQRPPRQ